MKNKKNETHILRFTLAIILIVAIVGIGISFFVSKNTNKHVDTPDIKKYVMDNSEYLTSFAKGLLEIQSSDDPTTSYDWKEDLPENADNDRLYKDLWIHYVFAEKSHLDYVDNVEIVLRNKNGNYTCGIYYSPSGKLLEHGHPKEGDTYEYDGTKEGNKHKYRSEKICDYWYYYEDDTWN